MQARLIPIAAAGLISLLSGCATTKEDVFPKDMKPMSEVYDQHFARVRTRGLESARARLHEEHSAAPGETAGGSELPKGVIPQLAGYTREVHNEIEALFPVLPNPQLVMYVYPHLGEDGAPVPGYATAFPLYERVEYALPGEAP